jgi:outer membrane protease
MTGCGDVMRKHSYYIVGILLIIVKTLSAEHNALYDHAFSFISGTLNNIAKEYVYEDNKVISRLDWQDTKPVPFLQLKDILRINSFFFEINLLNAIPAQGGIMEDYDFIIPDTMEPSQYSKHDGYLDKHFDLSGELGYSLYLGNWILEPALGFLYRNRKWTASDGYLQYPISGPWTGDEPKQELSGTVISYEQAVWFPMVSLEAEYIIKKIFGLRFTSKYYPYIWAETIDHHFLRDTRFYDTLEGGIGAKAGLVLRYYPRMDRNITINLGIDYERIFNLTGNTASGYIGIGDDSLLIDKNYGSRMESSTFILGVGIEVRF